MKYILLYLTIFGFSLNSFAQFDIEEISEKQLLAEHINSTIFYDGENFEIHFKDLEQKSEKVLVLSEKNGMKFEQLLQTCFEERKKFSFKKDGVSYSLLPDNKGCYIKWNNGQSLIYRPELKGYFERDKLHYLKSILN